jgi:predicted CopG family antitoxin
MITNRQDKRLEVAKMVRLDDDVHDQLTNLDKKNESYSDVVNPIRGDTRVRFLEEMMSFLEKTL